jgi:hypothetical protein
LYQKQQLQKSRIRSVSVQGFLSIFVICFSIAYTKEENIFCPYKYNMTSLSHCPLQLLRNYFLGWFRKIPLLFWGSDRCSSQNHTNRNKWAQTTFKKYWTENFVHWEASIGISLVTEFPAYPCLYSFRAFLVFLHLWREGNSNIILFKRVLLF